MTNESGGATPPSSLEFETLELCEKCHKQVAVHEDHCLSCYVEDCPDTQLIFGDR